VLQGVVVTIVLAAVTSGVFSLLAIDEDDAWYRQVMNSPNARVPTCRAFAKSA